MLMFFLKFFLAILGIGLGLTLAIIISVFLWHLAIKIIDELF